jgi:hypothetical protein
MSFGGLRRERLGASAGVGRNSTELDEVLGFLLCFFSSSSR